MISAIDTAAAAAMTPAAVLEHYRVNPETGLNEGEAVHRRGLHGENKFAEAEETTLLMQFLEQFKDPMIGLLGVSAIVSVAMGQYDDAISISLAVVIVTIVAFVQEYRSDQSLAALGTLAPPRSVVFREGQWRDCDSSELVLGDIVKLQVGDRIPADVRLLAATQMSVDEATLTGEGEHASKSVPAIETPVSELSDRRNIGFMGTMITRGKGTAVVVGIGDNTAFGVVFSLMRDTEETRTPLQERMDSLGKRLSAVSIAIIAVIALLGWIVGKPMMEMFTIGVSLAVAAIPEGLPIVVTVTLALGVMRMARKNAIVKKLPAVEALGCASVVCVDKTGTLTQNEMTVVEMFSPAEMQRVTVTGAGFDSEGDVCVNGEPASPSTHPHLRMMLEIGSVCNDADMQAQRGQPTELALQVAASKLGCLVPLDGFTRTKEMPFSSVTKWMAVRGVSTGARLSVPVYQGEDAAPAQDDEDDEDGDISSHVPSSQGKHEEEDGEEMVEMVGEAFYVKGTTQAILARCTRYVASSALDEYELDELTREKIMKASVSFGSKGLRVLALAGGPSLKKGLTFAGLVAIKDPLRPTAKPSVEYLRRSGVAVAMITGDSRDTACSIAAEVGIVTPDVARNPMVCMSGPEIEQCSLEELADRIGAVRVFYRAAPQHKMSIVKAFQKRGHVVAMTGDGVNDAPALKAAQIGVALGKAGTDVCKEAADMILVDDDVSTMLSAIEEGKSLFYNIRNFVRFQISTSVAALWLVAYSTITGRPNPLNAMQILWINILMDGPPAQSLGVEPVDLDVMQLPPRPAKEPIVTKRLISLVALSAFFIVVGTELVFVQEMSDGQVTRRDTTMTFTTFVMFDMFAALSCRSATKSVLEIGFFTNKFFLLAVGCCLLGQLAVIYMPPLQAIFQTEALSFGDLVYIVALSSTVLIADELRKLYERSRGSVVRASAPPAEAVPLFASAGNGRVAVQV